jgi:hypothetical protein
MVSQPHDNAPSRDGGLKLGLRQLATLLHRQWLIKRRSPVATVFEVLAPVLLMSCLVLGANLSTVVRYPQEIFADKGRLALLLSRVSGVVCVQLATPCSRATNAQKHHSFC